MDPTEVCSFKFNNRIVGFFPRSKGNALVEDLRENLGIDMDCVHLFTGEEAAKVIAPFGGEDCGPFTQLKRFFQRAIGGGIPEFLRDVHLISDSKHKCLICVLVEDESTKDQVADLMRKHHGKKIKYFHPMYVEHLTLEKNHEQISLVEEGRPSKSH